MASLEVVDVEQELINSSSSNLTDYEDSEDFMQFKKSLNSEISNSLNDEMDFIEKKTQEVTLFLDKNVNDEKNSKSGESFEDSISDKKSAIRRSPAIEADEQNFKTDEELSTLFDAQENIRRPRRIRSR